MKKKKHFNAHSELLNSYIHFGAEKGNIWVAPFSRRGKNNSVTTFLRFFVKPRPSNLTPFRVAFIIINLKSGYCIPYIKQNFFLAILFFYLCVFV